ncbi:hypothetical protein ACFQLX_21920 [Streptomyces polyrhachis]|uniref:Uncharacterized protein n=1 Tax=Streptomyces polyrhachis TaxID=1282885 RepID=A0ABW2GJ81_9ACTN
MEKAQCSYPRVIKRARHNSYRVKRSEDTGSCFAGPPATHIYNIPTAA